MFNNYFREKNPWITRLALYVPLWVPGLSVFTIRIGSTRFIGTYVCGRCISKLKLED
jgi:hypothetical protein